ncbi:MAG: hypothetical protein JSR88_09570 [Proteobacteria bacterium]|nr:hypothetical protein [Pseudomonadota bacterium]
MAEVVSLPQKVERVPIEPIVELLERLIDRAKRGDIRAFAYAVVREGFWIEQGVKCADDEPVYPSLIGAVATLQGRLVRDNIENSIVGEEV